MAELERFFHFPHFLAIIREFALDRSKFYLVLNYKLFLSGQSDKYLLTY